MDIIKIHVEGDGNGGRTADREFEEIRAAVYYSGFTEGEDGAELLLFFHDYSGKCLFRNSFRSS